MQGPRSRGVTGSLLAFAAGLVFPTAGTANDSALHSHDAEIGEVVVTGSRIPMPAATPLAPITVLELPDVERGDPSSIAQVLQALPFNTGSPSNTNVNNGGDGSSRVDLRGLGPGRTLVLLNGRRLPNGGIGADTSVDLNMIPVGMIDRVEVLTNGASAIYGADAVSGVINLITRSSFEGVQLDASRSVTSQWDGGMTHAQVVAGGGTDGAAHAMVGFDYTKQSGVTLDRRAYSAAPLVIADSTGALEYFGSITTPYGPIRVPAGNILGLAPGRYALNANTPGTAASDYHPFTAADTFNPAPYSYSQTPVERKGLWLQGSMPAGPATASAEGMWSDRTSSQRLAPTPYASDLDGAPQLADGSSGIPADNYYNPFGVNIPLIRRRFVEFDDRGFAEHVQTWRVLVGLRGDLGTWHWESSVAYSTSNATTRESGLISVPRLLVAAGSSGPDAAGNIVCGAPLATGVVPAANVIAGCVPVDLFGGPGTVTPAQVGYLRVPLTDHGRNSQRIADVGAGGNWGSVLDHPISWSTGFTYRREAGSYRYDPLRAGGTAGSGLQADIPGGEFNSDEVYAEARAPLAEGLGGVRVLETSTGIRYVHFSNFGGHLAWQAGFRWQPLSLVSLRANYGAVFRAPSLAELYQSRVRLLSPDAVDPCGNAPTPSQQGRCSSLGVPGGSYVQDPDQGVLTIAGGNPQLRPERGTSFDAGADINWESPLRVRASVDFFRTALKGYISQASPQTLLDQCIEANVSDACSHIERNADGSLQQIVATAQNFGRTVVRGLDFSLNLSRATSIGQWQTGVLSTYLLRRDKQPFNDSAPVHYAGEFDGDQLQAFPHWRGLGHVTWQLGPWQATYSVQYIGGLAESVELDDGTFRHVIPSVTYHDFECAYALVGGSRLRIGVSNFTNEEPPFVSFNSGDNTDAATYRLLGRTYFVDLRVRLN